MYCMLYGLHSHRIFQTSDSVPANTFHRLCRIVRKVSRFGSAHVLETNSKCVHAAPNKNSTSEPTRAPLVGERFVGSLVIELGSLEAARGDSASARPEEGQSAVHTKTNAYM